jgi:hypothetical protein
LGKLRGGRGLREKLRREKKCQQKNRSASAHYVPMVARFLSHAEAEDEPFSLLVNDVKTERIAGER